MAQFYSSLLFIVCFLFPALLTAQNVGIGVPSPSEKLEVAGNVYAQRLLVKTNSVSTTSDLSFTANAHIETDNSMTFSIDANDAGAAEYFGFGMNSASRNASFVELMRIEEGGNVGIGTPSPSFKLDVDGTGRFTGFLSVPLLPTSDEHAASKKYVDDQIGGNDDWDENSGDIFNNNAGNVGIGNSTPAGQLHVVGNVIIRDDNAQQLELRRSEDFGGLAYAMVEPRTPIPSIKKASEITYGGTSTLYPNVFGESDAQGACLSGLTYAQAVAEAELRGARLPTIEELEADVTAGTGCGFDNEIVWTQTKAGNGKRWVNYGKPSNFTTGRQALDETATASLRLVAEEDKGNLPAITDSEGALRTDKIKARVGNGIEFVDDNDNVGITLLDGANLRFDNYANGFLEVDGSGNVSSVSTIPSGSITEDDPTWNGAATTSSDIDRTGKILINGGSTAGTYTNSSVALEIDHGGDGNAAIQMNGSTAPYRIAIQDGHGRVHHYWNAYDSGSDHRFDVSSETATWMETGSGAGFQFRTHPGGTAGDIINWNLGLEIDENGKVGVGGVANASYELYVNGKIGSNGIRETSDRRFKKDIQPLENAMDKVRQLNGVSYYWRADEFPERKFDDQQDLGVIAQEVEKILPQVVGTDVDGYKSVQYSHIVPLLIEALKEQEKDFNKKLEKKDAELSTLKAQVEKIENYLEQNSYPINGYSVKK